MSIFSTIRSWWARTVYRHHARRRDQFLRVVEILAEAGEFSLAQRMLAEAEIQDAYAKRAHPLRWSEDRPEVADAFRRLSSSSGFTIEAALKGFGSAGKTHVE